MHLFAVIAFYDYSILFYDDKTLFFFFWEKYDLYVIINLVLCLLLI